MKNISTIVSDLDGTLLNEHSELSDYTVKVLKSCIKKGIRVILASGRTQNSMRGFVELLGTNQPYISGNGSEISSADHRLIYLKTIPCEHAKEIITFLEDSGLYVQAYQGECFFYSHLTQDVLNYQKASKLQAVCVENLAQWLSFPTNKMLCISNPECISKMIPIVSRRFEDKVEVTAGNPRYLEIIAKGVSKGNALRKLADIIHIVPQQTVIFGDCMNDISMLQFTENSVAVANAQKEVLQTVNYVCGLNTQDGVAHFIEKEVLSE